MGRDLEAVALPNDSSAESSGVQERPIVQFPTTENDRNDWQSKFASMRDSGLSSTKDILPGLELTGDLSPFGNKNLRGGNNSREAAMTGEDTLLELEQKGQKELSGTEVNQPNEKAEAEDQIVSNGTEFGIPVQEQLRSLQQQESDLLGQDQNKGDDDPGSPDTSVEVNGVDASAPIHSYGYQAAVDEIGEERKEKFEDEFGNPDNAVQNDLESLQNLAASALAGDVASLMALYNTGLPSQGLEQVSIYDLKMRKETDGQVVLLAPRGDGACSDGVPLVRDDGRPVSAMELGQYLRSDGTLLMGLKGQAYRPGDVSFMSPPEVAGSTRNLNADFSGKSLMSEQNELMSATATLASGINEAREKFATLIDTKSQARSLKLASLTSTDSNQMDLRSTDSSSSDLTQQKTDLVQEPRDAAQEQRAIKTRLGETLRSIALRDLNDVRNWQLLAEKNNLSTDTDARGNPIAMLQRGMTLTLPSASEIEDFQARASLAASSLS
ncbi:MAG TPA: hypothetical protein V6C89_17060 [Drouetiella sp.]|jgi:hypothetical protein